MFELKANSHIHTLYSDGSKHHGEIAQEAIRANLDVIFITDHNIFVNGFEKFYENKKGRVLLIMGEEIHDSACFPQKNHLLSLGAGKSFAHLSQNRPKLIEEIKSAGGISFIAHPYDPALPTFKEKNISWVDWSVTGFTGIELWNGFSELKVRVKKKFSAFFYAFFPKFLPLAPPKETISIWNDLLNDGHKMVVVGGSDAHAMHFKAGPLKRILFPYRYHFSTINNHILLKNKLNNNDLNESKKEIINSLQQGTLFIANDAVSPSKGFRFYLSDGLTEIQMGESRPYKEGMVLSVIIPKKAECNILKDGNIYKQLNGKKVVQIEIESPGIYRVECYKYFLGRKRGWIFSNPIYLE